MGRAQFILLLLLVPTAGRGTDSRSKRAKNLKRHSRRLVGVGGDCTDSTAFGCNPGLTCDCNEVTSARRLFGAPLEGSRAIHQHTCTCISYPPSPPPPPHTPPPNVPPPHTPPLPPPPSPPLVSTSLSWPQNGDLLGTGNDARKVIITSGVVGGWYVNSGTPMTATIFEAASPAPSATFKAWYMAINNAHLKLVRVDIAQSAGQLTLTVSHARYSVDYYVGANIDDIFGSINTQTVATCSGTGTACSTGYGAASVTYQIAY